MELKESAQVSGFWEDKISSFINKMSSVVHKVQIQPVHKVKHKLMTFQNPKANLLKH